MHRIFGFFGRQNSKRFVHLINDDQVITKLQLDLVWVSIRKSGVIVKTLETLDQGISTSCKALVAYDWCCLISFLIFSLVWNRMSTVQIPIWQLGIEFELNVNTQLESC